MTKQMRAAVTDAAGGAEQLTVREVPRPEPGLSEVLVRVRAAGLNPVDYWSGYEGELPTGQQPPFVLGWEFAGRVASTGPGVTRWRAGDDVFALAGFPQPLGAHAEYVLAPAAQLVRKPSDLPWSVAGSLPLVGATAWQALVDTANLTRGQRVLIHAAAGGVGHIAVQLARTLGAHVIGTASPHKHDLVRELGAHEMVDYHDTDAMARIADIDVVLDTRGGAAAQADIGRLRPGGQIVTLLPMDPDFPEEAFVAAGLQPHRLLVEPDPRTIESLVDEWSAGRLRVLIDREYPLDEVSAAHQRLATETATGKIVLIPSAPGPS